MEPQIGSRLKSLDHIADVTLYPACSVQRSSGDYVSRNFLSNAAQPTVNLSARPTRSGAEWNPSIGWMEKVSVCAEKIAANAEEEEEEESEGGFMRARR